MTFGVSPDYSKSNYMTGTKQVEVKDVFSAMAWNQKELIEKYGPELFSKLEQKLIDILNINGKIIVKIQYSCLYRRQT